MNKTLKKIFGTIPYLLLLAAFILIISLAFSLKKGETPTIFGRAIFIVVSPSMEDTLMVGDVIFVDTTPDALHVGDIISYHKPDQPDVIITHRIVSMETRDGVTYYTTKGDNNPYSLDWEKDFTSQYIVGKYMSKSTVIGKAYEFLFANGFTLMFIVIIGVFLSIGTMEVFNIIKQLSNAKEKEMLEEKEKLIQEELERLREEQKKEKDQ